MLHVLLEVHFVRRLLECLFVHRFSSSTQHALVTVFGVLFYVAAVLSPVVDALNRSTMPGKDVGEVALARLLLGSIAFVTASIWQWSSHRTLSEMRSAQPAFAYRVPTTPSFRLLLCPHYTAEMAIYAALCCIRPCVLQLSADKSPRTVHTIPWHLASRSRRVRVQSGAGVDCGQPHHHRQQNTSVVLAHLAA